MTEEQLKIFKREFEILDNRLEMVERISGVVERIGRTIWVFGVIIVMITAWVAGVNYSQENFKDQLFQLKQDRLIDSENIESTNNNIIRIAVKLGIPRTEMEDLK